MANQEHLDILKHGVDVWNQWRKEHPDTIPDLSYANLNGANLNGANLWKACLNQADLSGANLWKARLNQADLSGANFCKTQLNGANFSGANLSGANLSGTDLSGAKLSGTELSGANLSGANLWKTDLSTVTLSRANLSGVDLRETNLKINGLRETILRETNLSGHNLNNVDFSEMDLSGANLDETSLIKTNFSHANLSNCSIYGIAAWDIQLDEHTVQKNLKITPPGQLTITVDNLKIAQFIYLLLNNSEIRDVIDTITSKVVLILGRFTPERMIILDALREELRKQNYLPVLFDFDKPASRDITETISTLAHMARFVIADITDARSIPQELMNIVPNLPSVPVQPLILSSQHEYSMFEHFTRYSWVLPVYRYSDEASLLEALQEKIIAPAEQKAQELAKR
jgi:uncharacterized protein YjbI with pentapeptide repeats